ncbi:peroxiredoxin-like family protein [Alteribacillus sp. HJP-4]|uniref:peroxiredoxin-like family protein n=1 Tax=Alteribacillus sp. HJP-4 TaxID=2775394 RepID=UPI0035CCF4DD
MRENADSIQKQNIHIRIIFPAPYSLVGSFEQAFGPYPFPLYADPDRKAFRGMGHDTANKAKLLAKAAGGILSGRVKDFIPKDPSKKKVTLQSMKTTDVYIQGGTWLFNENNEDIWTHLDDSPENHASISQIINVINNRF